MEKDFTYTDGVRWELFEYLLPKLLYLDQTNARIVLPDDLREDGQQFIYSVLAQMCTDDEAECPYKLDDFDVRVFLYNDINFIQIDLPPYNPAVNDIARAYILQSGDSESLYFIVKHFQEGETFILYVDPQLKAWKMEELTDHVNDMSYEYWRLAANYLMIKQDRQAERDVIRGDWSRDWLSVDWSSIKDKILKGEKNIGISEEEYLEFLRWCAVNDTEIYNQTVFYLAIKEWGISDDSARYLAGHPDEFREVINRFEK